MRSGKDHLNISTARADALFASTLQRSDDPSTAQIRQAISTAIRAAGARGCAAQVAQAYGEHPETAMPRMRWARAEVTRAFGGTRDGAQPEPARTEPARTEPPARAGRRPAPSARRSRLPPGIAGGRSSAAGWSGRRDRSPRPSALYQGVALTQAS